MTFKDNYKQFHKATGIDVVQHPELLEEVYYAIYAGCWYWKSRGLTAKADAGDYEGVTRGILGSVMFQVERLAWLHKAKRVFV